MTKKVIQLSKQKTQHTDSEGSLYIAKDCYELRKIIYQFVLNDDTETYR